MYKNINVYPVLPIYKPLTYKIPEYLYEYAQEGKRVIIPFKSKKIMGIIYGKQEEEIPEEKIKEIECVLDEKPILDGKLLKLCFEISKYYFVPFGETIKLFLSPDFLDLRDPLVKLTLKGSLEGDEKILELLQKPKNLSFFQKSQEYFEIYLRSFKEGWIEVEERTKSLRNILVFYYLPPLPLEFLIKKAGKSKKKIEVLKFLKEKEIPLPYGEIKKYISIDEDLLKKMCRENLLLRHYEEREIFQKRHWISEKQIEPLKKLTEKQEEIFKTLEKSLEDNTFNTFLLYGVTASGKSEIYLHLADRVIRNGGKVLILVPEIALTPYLATRVINLWKGRASIYHSNLGIPERRQVYKKALSGEIDIVVGTRSALFLPLSPLKLIIVDEEQDPSYKQEETPRYNGRDVAVLRGSIENSLVLLASATPSFETMANCEKGKYKLLKLNERIQKKPLPEIKLINIKEEEVVYHEHGWVIFTKPLLENLKCHIERGNQAILLIPRRGYAPILLCRVCGTGFLCPDCSISFTVHKRKNKLVCHWCGKEAQIPSRCPSCGGEVLESIGIATEKIYEVFQKYFPDTPHGILDRDTISKKTELKKLLLDFELGKVKVLIGTQLVAKGHHFPKVTFIGILNADFLLKFPDFRGPEKLFSLIVQVAGRAGRGEEKGEVYIQTENPKHYAIQCALTQDFEKFYEKEKYYRKLFSYPPFTCLALITIHSKNLKRALTLSKEIEEYISKLEKKKINIKGPQPAPLKKLKGEYRFQILISSESRNLLHRFLSNLKPFFIKKNITLDIDPLNFL